jgi:DNA-binding CsgD family transcriptional regulator
MYLFWLAYAEALARAGQIDAAVEALDRVEHYRHPSYRYVESNRLLVMGWVAASRGSASEAIDLAGEAADFAFRHGQLAREVVALQTAMQFGRNDSADRLVELCGRVKGLRAPVIAQWATAALSADGNELLRVSDELEKIGDRMAAADAAAHAAHVFDRLDQQRPRLSASARASRLMALCGGSTPATRAAATYFPLSGREREIATLIGKGHSNKEIADALFMSVRTVEGHIYRACTRMGLNNRSKLADVVQQFIV